MCNTHVQKRRVRFPEEPKIIAAVDRLLHVPSGPPHGLVTLPPTSKAPLTEKLEIFIDESPWLVTVTIFPALVFFMTTPLNLRLAAENRDCEPYY